jgi:hypothetical protein
MKRLMKVESLPGCRRISVYADGGVGDAGLSVNAVQGVFAPLE